VGFLDRLLRRRKTIANPRLDAALAALAAGDSPARRDDYYRILRDATLIVPSPGLEAQLPMDRHLTAEGEVKVHLIGMDAPDGSRAIVAFTSEAALLRWRPVGCPSLGLGMKDLAGLVLRNDGATLILNPKGPAGGLVTRAELATFAEGRAPSAGPAVELVPATRMQVRELPQPLPDKVAAAVRDACAAEPAVALVHAAEIHIGGGPARLLLGFALDPGTDPGKVLPRLLEDIAARAGDTGAEAIVLDGSTLAERVRALAPPVYRRNR
jgi:hypothetical protein